jgi:hypothetical protein
MNDVMKNVLSAGAALAEMQVGFDRGRLWAAGAVLLLGLVTGWSMVSTTSALRSGRWRMAWTMSWRLMSWISTAVSAGFVVLALILHDNQWWLAQFPTFGPLRVVESIAPLVAGIQAALLFSPSDEPALEVSLATPRPFAWVLLERLALLLLLQTTVALVGNAAALAIVGHGDALVIMTRWLAPTLLLCGVGILVTMTLREVALSVLLVGGLWFAMLFFGDAMVIRWPYLWPIHLYLPLGRMIGSDQMLNRLLLCGVGIGLLTVSALRLNNSERLLLGENSAKSKKDVIA